MFATSRIATLSAFVASALYVTMLMFSLASSAQAAELRLSWVNASGEIIAAKTLDLAALDALAQAEIVTTTPWNKDKRRFTGPSFADLAALGPAAGMANITALNDYEVEVPAEDWQTLPLVLATRIDGKEVPVYDKGPYWLMYPVDSLPVPLPQVYVSRMIWQIKAVVFHVR